jgi:ABC-type multidrug transport system ATPase subunit
MPQEIALYPEFSISETIHYYCKLQGLSNEEYKERHAFMVNFLNLPDPKRLVSQLSGGQRRRVSLCVALLHSPRLLILDEPTVGVDPMLRQRIWQYLQQVAATGTR